MIRSMSTRPTLEQVERLAREAAELVRRAFGPTVRVLWFGSWVTGLPAERSDVDLAVDAGRVLSSEEIYKLRNSLESLPTLRRIDLLDLHAVDEKLREEILESGRVI